LLAGKRCDKVSAHTLVAVEAIDVVHVLRMQGNGTVVGTIRCVSNVEWWRCSCENGGVGEARGKVGRVNIKRFVRQVGR
jgi:hypothetical protein